MDFSTIFYWKLCWSCGLVFNKQFSRTFQVLIIFFLMFTGQQFYSFSLGQFFVQFVPNSFTYGLEGGGGLFSCMLASILPCCTCISSLLCSQICFNGQLISLVCLKYLQILSGLKYVLAFLLYISTSWYALLYNYLGVLQNYLLTSSLRLRFYESIIFNLSFLWHQLLPGCRLSLDTYFVKEVIYFSLVNISSKIKIRL